MSMMTFKGAARRLNSVDISRLAHHIGCGEDHLHAVLEIETRGGGFDSFGRPKMLFEPHVFYRNLSGSDREEAVAAGLAYPRWGEDEYPSDSYPRLKKAMGINAPAALMSASWGLGQILGENHRMADYETPLEMVKAFLDDEETHLTAMVNFIVSAGLDDELRNEDWRGFARGYNGPGYASYGYHSKLAAAYRKWQAIPDTPFTPDRSPVNPNPPRSAAAGTRDRTLRRGMQGEDVRMLQGTLAMLGYHSGRQDGIFGQRTDAAVRSFQADSEIETDGIVGENTWRALETARPKGDRDVTEDDLRNDGSRTVDGADKTEIAAGGLLSLPVLQEGLAVAQESQGVLEWGLIMVRENWPFLLAGVILFGAVMWLTGRIRTARVDDARKGRNLSR